MADQNIKIPWDGWRIVREIGRGSFGTVYEIERQLYNNTEKAAMKVISIPRDRNALEMMMFTTGYDDSAVEKSINEELHRVEQEYSVLSKLSGISNIVSVADFACVPNAEMKGYTVFIRMELLKSLQALIQEKRRRGEFFTEEETIKLGMDICRALTVCEKYDIIHRDIKPQNIMVSSLGDYNLGDFGTARQIDHTTQATYAGTVSFMAPEVLKHQKYGRTIDIYSLGLVMYWLMNRYRMPFVSPEGIPAAQDLEEAEQKRVSGEMLPPACDASPELNDIILKACSYSSGDRYRSASDMLDALENLSRNSSFFNMLNGNDSTVAMFHTGDTDDTATETVGWFNTDYRKHSYDPAGPVDSAGYRTDVPDDSGAELYNEITPEIRNETSHKKYIFAAVAVVLIIAGIAAFIMNLNSPAVSETETPAVNEVETPAVNAPETLSSYLENHPDEMAVIENAANDTPGMKISIIGNQIQYNYDISEFDNMTPEIAASEEIKAGLINSSEENKDTFTQIIKDVEDQTGIEGITMRFNYYYGDELLCWIIYNSSGIQDHS